MYDTAWWGLYVYVMNNKTELRNEVYKVIEDLLPWLDIDMWNEYNKKKNTRENTDFQNQISHTGVDMSQFDLLTSSDSRQSPDSDGDMLNEILEQQPRSMRDLFQGQLPTESEDI